MNELEKIRTWLNTYDGISRLEELQVDYYTRMPDNGSIAPAGLVELSRREDILGNVEVQCQYNFGLYFLFAKAVDDAEGSADNAAWVMDLQRWVQQQSVLHKIPTFGDAPQTETARAQNGELIQADEEGTAVYMVQLSIEFTKKYEVTN